jgi:hypothetical protein
VEGSSKVVEFPAVGVLALFFFDVDAGSFWSAQGSHDTFIFFCLFFFVFISFFLFLLFPFRFSNSFSALSSVAF